MVIVKLMGGLGNQLFQYALGRNLAQRNNDELKLDISYFEDNALRKYRLGNFQIKEDFATTDEVTKTEKIFEPDLSFHGDILQRLGDIHLIGYWQSEKYFRSIGDLIRLEFVLKNEISLESRTILNQITNFPAVAIHVRRGDYVTNQVTNAYLGLCSLDYYAQAVKKLKKSFANLRFFIFTDDPNWVASVPFFQDLSPTIVVNNLEKEWEDLYLMSQCKYFVIANSSFSWWGAWLSPQKNKVVYAPSKWFKNPDANSIDIVPVTWYRL